jgi:hypothetical protein
MCALKRLPAIPLPRRDNGALVPALLSGLLLLMLALQLVLPRDAALPETAGGMAPRRQPSVVAVPAAVDPVILSRALFAPSRVRGAGSAQSAGPLDGAAVVGLVRNGRSVRVMIAEPGGRFTSLAIGAAYHGFRLIGANAQAAIFAHDGERLVVAFSSGVTASDTPAAQEEEQVEE